MFIDHHPRPIPVAFACVLAVLVIAPLARAAEPPTTVHVTLLNDARLPPLTGAQADAILTRAADLIQQVCGRTVNFKVDARADAAAFLAEQRTRVAPYRIPDAYGLNPLTAGRDDFAAQVRTALRRPGGLKRVQKLVPNEPRLETVDKAANFFVEAYAKGLDEIAALKAVDGRPLLRADTWQDYCMGHWGVFVTTLPWTEEYRLYLSNTLLLDTTLDASQPEAVMLGAASNSTALPASRASVVAAHHILSGGISKSNPRLGALGDEERRQAVAYVVAQTIGVHQLLGRDADDSAGGGLARSISALADKADFIDVARMSLPKSSPGGNRMRQSKVFKTLVRMDVLAAQGRFDEVIEEGERVPESELTADAQQQVSARRRDAERRMTK